MWRLIVAVGVGIVSLLVKDAIENEGEFEEEGKKRVFISFAMEDIEYRGHLVSQAKSERTPFTLIDMSEKEPWKEKVWQQRSRSKIKSCDGLIVLLSKNIWHSSGARWEIK
jgi:MTH538 TIR-like domain (DUF1863).